MQVPCSEHIPMKASEYNSKAFLCARFFKVTTKLVMELGDISLNVQFELTFLVKDNIFVKKFISNIVGLIQFIDKHWITYTGAYQMWHEIFFVMPSLYEFPCQFYFKKSRKIHMKSEFVFIFLLNFVWNFSLENSFDAVHRGSWYNQIDCRVRKEDV